ncbi:flagellar basal body-associated FliL family protein [Marinobacter persicus]|nr:flagellar basal body-associated FliL family protein [Marinobacter persicus]GHD40677.1 hypothetical protein GCM10008110_01830 [Marinobacter persicus]
MTIARARLLTLIFLFCTAFALPVQAQDEAGDDTASEENADAGEEAEKIVDYIEMKPAFVTHIGQPGNKVDYLKAAVTLRASSEGVREAVEAHMPRLRHELVLLFGEQTDTARVDSNEGKQALVEAATQRINQVLEEQQTGEQITSVFFTEYVVQR